MIYPAPHCVYCTFHSMVGYYIGKGITQDVARGYYKGSGSKLKAAFKIYPKEEWTTEIWLMTFDEQAAYDYEYELVNFDTLRCPEMLNMVPGGKGGATGSKRDPVVGKKISESLKARNYVPSDETRIQISKSKKGKKQSVEWIANKVTSRTGMKYKPRTQKAIQPPRTKEQIEKMRLAKSKPCTIDGITIYPSHRALTKALGQGKAGAKHPDFRYI